MVAISVNYAMPAYERMRLINFVYFYIFFGVTTVGSHIVVCADDTTIYAVIPRSLLSPQVMELLNPDLAVINTWCSKWHTRLNPKKTKSWGNPLTTTTGAEILKSSFLWKKGLCF